MAHARIMTDEPAPGPVPIVKRALVVGGGPAEFTTKAVDALGDHLTGPSEQLRLHAAWALGRIGGERAAQLLAAQKQRERVAAVGEEIELAARGLRLTGSK